MLKKFLIFTIFLSQIVLSKDPDPYVEALHEKKYLKLPNGKEIIISHHSRNENDQGKIRIFMRSKNQVIWDKTFVNNYGEFWYRANFIPVIKDDFFNDLNEDNYPEIGIAIWSGGMASWESSAIIFSVKEDSLEFLRKQKINIEFSLFIFQRKENFNDHNYKCPVCEPKEYFYADGKSKKLNDWPK